MSGRVRSSRGNLAKVSRQRSFQIAPCTAISPWGSASRESNARCRTWSMQSHAVVTVRSMHVDQARDHVAIGRPCRVEVARGDSRCASHESQVAAERVIIVRCVVAGRVGTQ